MRRGCLYWFFIGWWLEPIIFIFNLIFGLPLNIKQENYKTIYDNYDFEDDFYSESDLDDIKEDMRSDIEDELRDKLEWEIRDEIESEYYGNTSLVSSKVKDEDKKEIEKMYDKEKGIYPSGQYLVGRDIPLGGYVLTARNKETAYVQLYPSYAKYKKEEDSITYQDFKDDFHIALMENNTFLVVENADIQKI